MEKNFLINLHRLFVVIRNDINNPENKRIVEIILESLNEKAPNKNLIKKIKSIDNKKSIALLKTKKKCFFVLAKSNAVNYGDIHKILIYSVNKIQPLLIKGAYEEAYAVVDAIHCLPEIFADGRINNLGDYWTSYIEPIRDEWGKDYFNELHHIFRNR